MEGARDAHQQTRACNFMNIVATDETMLRSARYDANLRCFQPRFTGAHRTPMSIAEKVRDYIKENFLFGADNKIGDQDSLLDAGVIDSTGAMELVSFIETQFDVEVSDRDLVPENLDSIAAITSFITRKLTESRDLGASASPAGG